jgi:hypothetical protein
MLFSFGKYNQTDQSHFTLYVIIYEKVELAIVIIWLMVADGQWPKVAR